MGVQIRLDFEPCRSIDGEDLTGAYAQLGTPLLHSARIVIFQNFTSTAVWLSKNGVDDHLCLVPNGYMILDLTSNKTIPVGFFLSQGDQIYVKLRGLPVLSGYVDFSAIYGDE